MAKGARDISLWNLAPYGTQRDEVADPGEAIVTPLSPAPAIPAGISLGGTQAPAANAAPASVGILGTPLSAPSMATPAVAPPAPNQGFSQKPVYNPPRADKAKNWFMGTLMGVSPVAMEANQRKAYDEQYASEMDKWQSEVRSELNKDIDMANPESLRVAGDRAFKAGADDLAGIYYGRAKEREALLDADAAEQFSYLKDSWTAAKTKVEKYRNVQSRINEVGGVENLTQAEKITTILEYARSVNPEAVNEGDIARLTLQPGMQWKDIYKLAAGLIPGASGMDWSTPDSAIKDILAAMETDANVAIGTWQAFSDGTRLGENTPDLRGLMPDVRVKGTRNTGKGPTPKTFMEGIEERRQKGLLSPSSATGLNLGVLD